MRVIKRSVAVLVALAMFLALPQPVPAALGPHMKARVHLPKHSYNGEFHHIGGRVRIKNGSDKAKDVRCRVVAVLTGGGTTKKGADRISARVGAGEKRAVHTHIKIHDPGHVVANIPSRRRLHCHASA
ncbi:MAG: hypothetical protein WD276_08135 [Actinomycetota bacterium]